MQAGNDTGVLDRPTAYRKRPGKGTGEQHRRQTPRRSAMSRAEAMAAAFGIEPQSMPTEGTFEWDLNTDVLRVCPDAARLFEQVMREPPVRVPDLISRLQAPDQREFMTALVHTMRHGGPMDVRFSMLGRGRRIRIHLRGRRDAPDSPTMRGWIVCTDSA